MRIGGFEACSLIDFPGKISCIVYTIGCNLRCKFCFNPDLLSEELFGASRRNAITEGYVLKYVQEHSDMLDGVAITGGEPTLQSDLPLFCQKIKRLNKSVKLDTNGWNPEMLRTLISQQLVDYIAMDLKGPWYKFEQITGVNAIEKVQSSIGIVKKSGIPHEFRLTVYPEFTKEDIIETARLVFGEKLYLQIFEPQYAFDIKARALKPIQKEELQQMLPELNKIADVKIRG